MKVRFGLDIGATKTKILMISPQGKVLHKNKIMTDSDKDPKPIVERASAQVQKLIKKNSLKKPDIEAVSVGIAGFSNPKTGMIDISPNLHWENVPFKKMMEDKLGLTVYMANDVNAAAWGEFVYGAGREARDMVAILLGSGIGGGVVTNGKLVEGGTGTAGEVGHMTFRVNGLKCDCGKRGCFEAYGGGMPMERRMRRATAKGLSPKALELAGGDPDRINTSVIRRVAQSGDKTAAGIWKDAEQSYITLCANLTSLLNPDLLVIGGGVLKGNPGLLETIRAGVDERAVSLSARHVEIVESELEDDGVAMGAAALVDHYNK